MPALSAGELERRNQARILYAAYIVNQQDLNNKSTVNKRNLSESDILTKTLGSRFTSYEEQQFILYNSLVITQLIITGNKLVSGSTSGLTQINFTGIYDSGYGSQAPISGVLDDAFVPIPMGGMVFNLFGTNYSNNISWDSNNAFIFGTTFSPHLVSVSATTAKSILIGNYDRLCTSIYYSNSTGTYSITTLIINFCNYYTDPGTPTYKYQIRLIKENVDTGRQFVEVCIITSPPSPGYSFSGTGYPSGQNGSGIWQDSDANIIDQTKGSPYNITNGTSFLNPCGTTFSTASPSAGTSFVFSSDSTGTNWTFTNNSYVNI
jgi:hypothetical protein